MPPGQEGLAFVVVLVVALALLLGTMALAGRSYFGVLGSAFQVQGREARSAAELGMTYALARLNQPRNRPFLVSTAKTNETTFDTPENRWASGAVPDSPCTPKDADGNILSPDNKALNGVWYVQNGTTVTATQPAGGTYRSFRILGVRRPSQNGDQAQPPESSFGLRIYRDRNYANLASSGSQPLFLRVEGSSFRNGERVATTTLEQEFEVVPKCCGRTFGGSHGNDVYNLDNKIGGELSACVPESGLGYGLLAGAGPGDGEVELKGTPSIESETGVPIDPIYCLVEQAADDPSTCTYSTTGKSSQVSLINGNIGLPETFTSATGATETPLALQQCTKSSCPSNSTATTSVLNDPTTFTSFAAADICANGALTCDKKDPNQLLVQAGDTIVNVSSVAESNLPANCRKTPSGTVASGTVETIHCNLSQFKPSSGSGNVVFRTTLTRRISLYFPNADTGTGLNASIIDAGGATSIRNISCDPTNPANCTQPTLSYNPTTLSILGCVTDGCGPQTIKLNGTPSTLFTFIWFPYGSLDYRGTSDLAGVAWIEDLAISGTPTFTVPGSGLGDVLCYTNSVECDTNSTPTENPVLFDWVARGTNRFRFIGR